MTTQTVAILADWGNTSLRFYLMVDGKIIETRMVEFGGVKFVRSAFNLALPQQLVELESLARTDHQVRATYNTEQAAYNVRKGTVFADVLKGHVGDWLSGNPCAPVILCGHVGSGEGWDFAAHEECPIQLDKYAHKLHEVRKELKGELSDRDIRIVQGFKYRASTEAETMFDDDGNPYEDIDAGLEATLRGEDVKLIGIYDLLKGTKNLVCMPGTHPQWAVIEGNSVTNFVTGFTGDLFELLCKSEDTALYDILQRKCDDKGLTWRSFLGGVKLAKKGPGVIFGLFSVRANAVAAFKAQPNPKAYLSGLLVGSEVGEATRMLGQDIPISLVTNSDQIKGKFYKAALFNFGYKNVEVFEADEIAQRGLIQVGQSFLQHAA